MTPPSPLQKTPDMYPEVQAAWSEFILSLESCRRAQLNTRSEPTPTPEEVSAISLDVLPFCEDRTASLRQLVDRIEAVAMAQAVREQAAQQKYQEGEKWRDDINNRIGRLHESYVEGVLKNAAIERQIGEIEFQLKTLITRSGTRWWHRLRSQTASSKIKINTISNLSHAG